MYRILCSWNQMFDNEVFPILWLGMENHQRRLRRSSQGGPEKNKIKAELSETGDYIA